MQKLHEDLSQKVSWYQRWHERDSHQYFHFIIFGAVTILAGVILLGQIDSYAKAFDGDESYPLAQSLNKENSRAISDLKAFEASTGAKKQEEIRELRKLLSSRKEKVLERMKNGDSSLVAGLLPDEIRSRMPDTVRDLVEEKVSLSGNLSAIFVDTIKEEDSYIEYSLEVYDDNTEETERYQVYFEKGHKFLKNGSKVKLSGYKLDDKVFVADDNGQSTQVLAESNISSDVTGNKSLLVILVNFSNDPSQPWTKDYVYNTVFVNGDSTKALISEGSYGKVDLTGEVTPWMTIAATNNSTCDYLTWASQAKQAANNAGYNTSGYNHVMYMLNGVSTSICNWGGKGYVPGTETWINGAYAAHGSKAHELGHNFGNYHAGFYDCSPTQIASSCSFDQYGERNSKMGGANNFQFNAVHKYQNAWIPSSQVKSVNSSGTYIIERDYSTSASTKVLKINKPDTGQAYYVSYKQASGFNASLGDGNTRGASVYLMPSSGFYDHSKLLSMQSGGGYTNSALWDGGVFTDTANGLTITQLSHTADTVTLDVQLSTPPCTTSNPSVSVSPASKTGAPGSALAYTVSVTNRNSTYCDTSTFTINPVVPTGFTTNPVNVNVAPGSTVNSNITVTSGATVSDGSYPYTVMANDNSNPVSSSASATYIVYTPVLDTTPPTVSISSPASGTKVSGRVNINVSASDNVGVAKVEFYIDNKLVTTDTTAPYSYRWNVNKKISAGNHTIMVKAYDAANNSASASIVVTK